MARIKKAQREGTAFVSANERRIDATFPGWFGVYKDNVTARVTLGYWLGEPFHRNGYMREASTAALEPAAAALQLDVIEAYVHPENTASLRIVLGLGFKADGRKFVHASARDRDELCLRFVKQLDT